MTHVQPPTVVADPQELPDVFDVRVAECEVVVPPVHPLAEADAPAGQLARRPDDDVAAFACELFEPVFLDLPLGVQAELSLDPHLDPKTLAVEPVLIPELEAPHGLVPLERVLEGTAPRGVDGKHLVRG